MSAGLKPPPKFVTNEWSWAYTLNKLAEKDALTDEGNPRNYAAAIAIYKRVEAKRQRGGYENASLEPVPVLGPALTRAELFACPTTWFVSRGFAWAANDSFTARLFTDVNDEWRIERIDDDGTAATSPVEWDTVAWLLRESPRVLSWAREPVVA